MTSGKALNFLMNLDPDFRDNVLLDPMHATRVEHMIRMAVDQLWYMVSEFSDTLTPVWLEDAQNGAAEVVNNYYSDLDIHVDDRERLGRRGAELGCIGIDAWEEMVKLQPAAHVAAALLVKEELDQYYNRENFDDAEVIARKFGLINKGETVDYYLDRVLTDEEK